MGGKGGVVAAAVVRVEDEGNVQHPGLQLGVGAVRPQNAQDVLRRGELGVRLVDEQALAVVIVAVGLVAVHRQQGEQRNQLHGLPQHVGDGNIFRVLVIGIEGEHAAGQGVHHVAAGGLHDDVPHKAGGQGAVKGKSSQKVLKCSGPAGLQKAAGKPPAQSQSCPPWAGGAPVPPRCNRGSTARPRRGRSSRHGLAGDDL